MFEIRRYEEKDALALSEFIACAYDSSYFLNDPSYRSWMYHDHPLHDTPSSYTAYVALSDNKVIGFQGRIPVEIYLQGRIARGSFFANLMVRPQYRGRGLGLKLVGLAMKETQNSIFIGSNDNWYPMMAHFGINTFDGEMMKRAVYLLDDDSLAGWNIRSIFNKTPARALPIASNILRIKFPDELDETLWPSVAARYGIATNRTLSYLGWRFFRHPRNDYHVLTSADRERPRAVCVIRLERAGDQKVGRIVDAWGEQDGLLFLLPHALSYLKGLGVCLADFICTQTPDKAAFDSAGFHWLEKPQAIPYLFNPVELRDRWHENVGIRLDTDNGEPAFNDLYFVKADSDRDR